MRIFSQMVYVYGNGKISPTPPQWAKLGGQAMQLDKALNFEDFE